MTQLNLGSGSVPEAGFVNVDIVSIPEVDVVWDLDKAPWPWIDQCVSLIKAYDIFEHVNDPILFMQEAWRVLRPGGVLDLHVVFWKSESAYTDPTHKRFCTQHTFDYWVPGTEMNDKYGEAYAGEAEFDKQLVEMDGPEMHVILRRCN
jgi:predicted SAM-dependent methyltransferase